MTYSSTLTQVIHYKPVKVLFDLKSCVLPTLVEIIMTNKLMKPI